MPPLQGNKNVTYRQGDYIVDVEPGDANSGPFSQTSQKAGTAYSLTSGGDIVLRTGGVERARIRDGGVISGFRGISPFSYGAVGDGVTDDTAAVQAAATAAGTAGVGQGKILDIPPATFKISSPISIPAGVSVQGWGLGSKLLCSGCDGLHMQGPWASIGPYFVRDLYIAGTGATSNSAGIRVDGALVANDSVSGYEISNVRIDFFGYGIFLRNLWRSSIYQVRMVNVYAGVYIKGQCVYLNFNGVVADKGTPPGTPTGLTNSAGFTCEQATDYNPGGNTTQRPESIHVTNSQFVNFDIGLDHQHCLVASYEGMDLDSCALYGVRFNQSDGGLRLKGDWIATTGTSSVAGIFSQDVSPVSTGWVEIDGFNITSYTASTGSNGIHLGDGQQNVTVRNCAIGPGGGGQSFQNADIHAPGVTLGVGKLLVEGCVLTSNVGANSLVIGGTAGGSGRAVHNLSLAKPILVGASAGTNFLIDPGLEIDYVQITANVNVTGTVSGSPTTVVTSSANSFDGTPVILEFFSPIIITPSVASGSLNIGLYESGSLVAQIASIITPAAANMRVPVCVKFRFSPTAGTHTYSIGSWVSSTTGTPLIGAGTGTAGANLPAYIRINRI